MTTMTATKTTKKLAHIVYVKTLESYEKDEKVGSTEWTRKDGERVTKIVLRPARTARISSDERKSRIAEESRRLQGEGFEVKILGNGSTELKAYKLTYTTVEVQRRGVCQGCGGDVAVDASAITSLHGYTRPGDGATHGECFGARRLAANVTTELTSEIIVSLTADAERLTRAANAFEVERLDLEAAANKLERYDAEWKMLPEFKKADEAVREKVQAIREATYRASSNRDYVSHLQKTALPALFIDFTFHAK